MNILATTILRRVVERLDTGADLARLSGVSRSAGGGLMSRIATAGILRLAFRWPALTVIVVLSVIIARVMSGRRHQPVDVPPALTGPRWPARSPSP